MYPRRVERLSQAIKQEVSNIILLEMKDPRISFLTVTRVDPSPDMRKVKVFISVLGDETKQKTTLKGLENAKGYVQHELGTRMRTKFTPVLSFHIDETQKKRSHIFKIIDEAVKGSDITIKSE